MHLWREISAPLPKSPGLGAQGWFQPHLYAWTACQHRGPPSGGWGRGTGAGRGWGASSWRPWRLAGRERGCGVEGGGLQSTMVLCFYGGPGLRPWTLLAVAVPRFSSFRLSLCHQPQSSPPVCPVNPQFQPLLTPANVCLRLGRQGQWHDQLPTLCSACHKPITALSSEPLKPLFYPDWSPCQWRGFRGSRDISAFSVPSQGHRFYLTSSFFPLFSYPVLWDLSCPFRYLRSSASVL